MKIGSGIAIAGMWIGVGISAFATLWIAIPLGFAAFMLSGAMILKELDK